MSAVQQCVHGWNPSACDDCVEPATATSEGGTVSVADDTMDQMVQRASVPNLATLFKRGQQAGLLKPGKDYGDTA